MTGNQMAVGGAGMTCLPRFCVVRRGAATGLVVMAVWAASGGLLGAQQTPDPTRDTLHSGNAASSAPAAHDTVSPAMAAADSALARVHQLVAEGKTALARAIVDSLLLATPSQSMAYASALYARASLATNADSAERDYRRITVEYSASPRASDALLRLAQLEIARGNRDQAAAHLARLTREQAPGQTGVAYARTELQVGLAYFDLEDVARACTALTSARSALPPTDVELRNRIDYNAQRCPRPAPAPAAATTHASSKSASPPPTKKAPAVAGAPPAAAAAAAPSAAPSVAPSAATSPARALRRARTGCRGNYDHGGGRSDGSRCCQCGRTDRQHVIDPRDRHAGRCSAAAAAPAAAAPAAAPTVAPETASAPPAGTAPAAAPVKTAPVTPAATTLRHHPLLLLPPRPRLAHPPAVHNVSAARSTPCRWQHTTRRRRRRHSPPTSRVAATQRGSSARLPPFRVRIGRYPTESAADDEARALKAKGIIGFVDGCGTADAVGSE